MLASIRLEKVGIPSVLIATKPFTEVCKGMARIGGAPEIKWATVPHPIGSLGPEDLMGRAKEATEQIVSILLERPMEHKPR